MMEALNEETKAITALGIKYLDGWGVDPDYEKAQHYLHIAAKLGSAEAQFNLAYMYDYGLGVKQNKEIAVAWYAQAAKNDHPVAENNLAYAYANGEGISQNYEFAIEWYRRAIEHGNSKALFNLGQLYWDGRGVEKNYKKSLKLYRLAAKQENESARQRLDHLYSMCLVPFDPQDKEDYEKDLEVYAISSAQKYLEQIEKLKVCEAKLYSLLNKDVKDFLTRLWIIRALLNKYKMSLPVQQIYYQQLFDKICSYPDVNVEAIKNIYHLALHFHLNVDELKEKYHFLRIACLEQLIEDVVQPKADEEKITEHLLQLRETSDREGEIICLNVFGRVEAYLKQPPVQDEDRLLRIVLMRLIDNIPFKNPERYLQAEEKLTQLFALCIQDLLSPSFRKARKIVTARLVQCKSLPELLEPLEDYLVCVNKRGIKVFDGARFSSLCALQTQLIKIMRRRKYSEIDTLLKMKR